VPLPQLTITGTGSNRTIQWPLFADDFQLEKTASLNLVSWVPAALPILTNVFGVQTAVPSGTNQLFFRLRK
jgi:hypothetical protein